MRARSQSSSIRKKHSNRSKEQKLARWAKAAVLRELKELADPKVRAKMAYFGVHAPKAYGISAPVLHLLAKQVGKDHRLARELWTTGIHEARILATLIGESEKVTAAEMERWVRDFDSWDVVDAACCYLYTHATTAWNKAAADARFVRFLRVIEREANDGRNFVKKAMNWALRNIGKKNVRLNREAI